VFRGTSAITLDSKNRITVPTRYREELLSDCQGKMVCTIDLQYSCLLLYPLAEWEEIEFKLCELSSMDRVERLAQQKLLGNATECELDKNGRLVLSAPLRKYAGLDKNIMLVGQLRKFEIWSESAWQAQMEQDISTLAPAETELPERLLELQL
tara:strand:- start:134 stop:592 length:459 start_codon:yes stop_codon:yes gene_type:complete